MLDEDKINVSIALFSAVQRHAIEKATADQGYSLHFFDSENIHASDLKCDVFVIDYSLFADRNFRLKELLEEQSPAALTLCLVSPEDVVPDLGDNVDWIIAYEDIRRGLTDAIRALQVIRKKAARGVLFDELLAVSRSVKHEACNALAIACGAAGQLIKIPGVAENQFYKQVVQSHDRLTNHLEKLADFHEKYRNSGHNDKIRGQKP